MDYVSDGNVIIAAENGPDQDAGVLLYDLFLAKEREESRGKEKRKHA